MRRVLLVPPGRWCWPGAGAEAAALPRPASTRQRAETQAASIRMAALCVQALLDGVAPLLSQVWGVAGPAMLHAAAAVAFKDALYCKSKSAMHAPWGLLAWVPRPLAWALLLLVLLLQRQELLPAHSAPPWRPAAPP